MIVGDIVELNRDEVFSPFTGEADVIIGGPPCQGFSQKGQRKSINDDRNFYLSILYLWLNLLNLSILSWRTFQIYLLAEKGYFKKEIYDLFESLGYSLNSEFLMPLIMVFPKIEDVQLL